MCCSESDVCQIKGRTYWSCFSFYSGKQIFGSQYATSGSKFDDGLVPRWNFVDFYHSFLLAWRVMCGEWIEPLHTCMFITDSPGCIALFVPMTIVGNFLVRNIAFCYLFVWSENHDNSGMVLYTCLRPLFPERVELVIALSAVHRVCDVCYSQFWL